MSKIANDAIANNASASLSRSVGMAVFACVLLGLVAVSALGYFRGLDRLESSSVASQKQITSLLSSQMGGGLRFKKASVIENTYAGLLADASNHAVLVVALDAKGEPVAVSQPNHPAMADAERLAKRALKSDGVARAPFGPFNITAAAATFGPQDAVAGSVAVVWDQSFMVAAVEAEAIESAVIGLAIALVMTAGLTLVLRAWVTKPLSRMAVGVDRMLAGEFVKLPGASRRDELGVLSRALTAIHSHSQASGRIRVGLESSSAGLMILNTDLDVVFVTPALADRLRPSAGHLGLGVEITPASLVGKNIDAFARAWPSARPDLGSVQDFAIFDAEFDNRQFRLIVRPATDASGGRIGYVVEWPERTRDIALQRELKRVIDAVVAGDFEQRVKFGATDENARAVAEGINRICQITGQAISDVATVMTGLASGELDYRISTEYRGQLHQLKQATNESIDQVENIVGQIEGAATDVADATDRIKSGADTLATRTEQQAAALTETATAIDRIAATIRQNSGNADEANSVAEAAAAAADRGGQVVSRAVTAMARIEESSGKISAIIDIIEQIAFQTNLLALNASVEAARAGDAGKGFAVVASEVRALAQRSSQSAKDISELISTSTAEVADGVTLVNQTGEVLKDFLTHSQQIAALIADIVEASREQSVGVEEITLAMKDLDSITLQNSDIASSSADSAQSVAVQAESLRSLVSFFKVSKSRDRSWGDHHSSPSSDEDYGWDGEQVFGRA